MKPTITPNSTRPALKLAGSPLKQPVEIPKEYRSLGERIRPWKKRWLHLRKLTDRAVIAASRALRLGKLSRVKAMQIGLLILAGIASLVLCGRLLGWFTPPSTNSESTTQTESSTRPTLSKGTPDFKAFVPMGKTIESYGGWTRVSPEGSAAVYAYSDNLKGTAIIVSQQKLPDSFRDDTANKIKQLQSDQTYASQHSITNNGLTIYVGVSGKNYQSSIFVKNDTLVLITSYRVINDTTISAYVESLR